MACRAVIFDLDGTLLDTLGELGDSMNAVLKQLDFPTHPLDAYRYFIGNGMRLLVERALPEEARTQETIEAALPLYQKAYEDRWNLSRPYDGIEALLSYLSKTSISLSVLSNKPDDFTQKCIRTLLPDTTFEVVRGHSDTFPKKPDPASALAISRVVDCDPADCLFVGDTSVDIET
ncbi:MAG: HAD-IA family hydrolase, partial [Verrucomicrobiota bacterium]